MQFTKYQGLGNNFVCIDLRDAPETLPAWFARAPRVCDVRVGVGADGILAIMPAVSSAAEARMVVINADGTEAEMCGNGVRCIAKHLLEASQSQTDAITIDTGAGPLTNRATWENGTVTKIQVNMGKPRFAAEQIPVAGTQGLVDSPLEGLPSHMKFTTVSMGNPHAVTFVDSNFRLRDLAEAHGSAVENHRLFPARINAEFATAHTATFIELVVWERGVGITQACGTGACATAVAACQTGLSTPETDIRVSLLGGDLTIRVSENGGPIWMTGPAERVFSGELP